MTDEEMAEEWADRYWGASLSVKKALEEAYLAGLKARLNIRSCQNCRHNNKSCPNDGSCNHYSKWESYKNPQLIKAKELLSEWVELFKPKYISVPPFPIQIKTEQFLKED
jgi:hypothetical protein